jgi:hypothetical protein
VLQPSDEVREKHTLLGSLERTNLNNWTYHVIQQSND